MGMGGTTTSTTNTDAYNSETQNINNAHNVNNYTGDDIAGNIRNLQGLQNNGSQCFGAGCTLMNLNTQNQGIDLQNLAPIERELLQKLSMERSQNPALYVQ